MSGSQSQSPAGGARPRVARRAQVFIGLGSNLGEREAHLAKAARLIAALRGVDLEQTSWTYDTAPIGPTQPRFLNAVIEVTTVLAPRELLQQLQKIEEAMGRVRDAPWGPRVIDLDILLWGNRSVSEPGLQIPHPRLHERAFVLEPLFQLCVSGRRAGMLFTVRELRDAVLDQDVVRSGPFPGGW